MKHRSYRGTERGLAPRVARAAVVRRRPGVSCLNVTSVTAFDASGSLMVAWWSCTGGSASLLEEYSTDGGATWPGTDRLIANINSIESPSNSMNRGRSVTASPAR